MPDNSNKVSNVSHLSGIFCPVSLSQCHSTAPSTQNKICDGRCAPVFNKNWETGSKMKGILRAALGAMLGITAFASQAQTEPVKAAFMAMPSDIAPLISEYAKLDMIDYFESGMETTTANVLDGQMRLTELTPGHIAAELGTAQLLDVYLLPTGADTLAMYISTLTVPVADSYISIVDSDTVNVTTRAFKAPGFRDWLSPQGKKLGKYVESELPYVNSVCQYSPDSAVLTLKLRYPATLSQEVIAKLEPLMLPELRYKWTGKKFTPLK